MATSEQAIAVDAGDESTVASVLQALTCRVALQAELNCILCHDVLLKPVTTTCGHTFCRICLLDLLLSRAVDEAQCPICRNALVEHLQDVATFNVNVTLWNIIQMLVPETEWRPRMETEEVQYTHRLDELQVKCRIRQLQEASSLGNRHNHRRRGQSDDDAIDSSDGEGEHHHHRESIEARHRTRGVEGEFVELRVDVNEEDGMEMHRNIMHDVEDLNEDGYSGMRVGLTMLDFDLVASAAPQECALALLKMEEDEDVDSGFPFFTDEDEDEGAFVMANYFNNVTLRVVDDSGNTVLERVRSAQRGIITFPGIQLDVPEGVYTFRFSDDLYGVYLSIKMTLSAQQNNNPGSPSEESTSFIADEAAEEGRRRRRRGRGRGRHPLSDVEESEGDDEDGEESDDSFIVNDDEEEETMGQFSDDHAEDRRRDENDNEEEEWVSSEEDSMSDGGDQWMHAREQYQLGHQRRQNSRQRTMTTNNADEAGDTDGDVAAHLPTRRQNNHVIDESDEDDHDSATAQVVTVECDEASSTAHGTRSNRKRARPGTSNSESDGEERKQGDIDESEDHGEDEEDGRDCGVVYRVAKRPRTNKVVDLSDDGEDERQHDTTARNDDNVDDAPDVDPFAEDDDESEADATRSDDDMQDRDDHDAEEKEGMGEVLFSDDEGDEGDDREDDDDEDVAAWNDDASGDGYDHYSDNDEE